MKNMLKLRATSTGIPVTYSTCHWRGCAGFTLIEVMITVVVIAIIAAIVLPGYQDYVRKGGCSSGTGDAENRRTIERYKSKILHINILIRKSFTVMIQMLRH